MKTILSLIFLLISTILIAQNPVKSGVYNWSDQKPDSDGKRKYFKGETTFFRSFEITAVTLVPGKNKKTPPSLNKIDEEQVIIVKEGELKIMVNKDSKVLGPGSIAHIMPGDLYSYENNGERETTFYHLLFASESEDGDRGKSGGGSIIIDWNDVEKVKTEKGARRNFYDRPTAMTSDYEMHVTTLNEGLASHAPHTHPQEEIVLLLRGNGRMEIDGKFNDVSPGALIFVASGVPHAIQNSGKGECEYFAFQWK